MLANSDLYFLVNVQSAHVLKTILYWLLIEAKDFSTVVRWCFTSNKGPMVFIRKQEAFISCSLSHSYPAPVSEFCVCFSRLCVLIEVGYTANPRLQVWDCSKKLQSLLKNIYRLQFNWRGFVWRPCRWNWKGDINCLSLSHLTRETTAASENIYARVS